MTMNKLKIVIWHLAAFIAGAAGIAGYVVIRLSAPSAGLGGVIVMPAIMLVYVVAFGIFCTISLAVWLGIAYFRNRRMCTKSMLCDTMRGVIKH